MARQPGDVIGDDGQVRVLARRCQTCIFWPGNRMGLAPGRFEQVVNGNLAAEALLTCHDTLPYGQHPDFGPAVCVGFWARHSRDVITGRLARMIGITRISPPGES